MARTRTVLLSDNTVQVWETGGTTPIGDYAPLNDGSGKYMTYRVSDQAVTMEFTTVDEAVKWITAPT